MRMCTGLIVILPRPGKVSCRSFVVLEARMIYRCACMLEPAMELSNEETSESEEGSESKL